MRQVELTIAQIRRKPGNALADEADLVTRKRDTLANHDWPDRIRRDEELVDLDPNVVYEPDALISPAEIPVTTNRKRVRQK